MIPSVTKLPQKGKGRAKELRIVEATTAAENIQRRQNRGKLGNNELADLLYHIAAGATYKFIRNFFRSKYNRAMSDTTIAEYKDKYSGRVGEVAARMEKEAIQLGLSKKSTRILKLQELAEALASAIFNENGEILERVPIKILSEYREVLKLLAQECGDIANVSVGDTNFIGMSNEDVTNLIARKLETNRDMAIVLADASGNRPVPPENRKGENSEEE